MKTRVSHSLKETSNIAQEWLKRISADPSNGGKALVVGLSGHLGAGKTAFVKALAKHLGVAEEITSPTFVIMKIYPTTHPRFKKLVHIDAYRLEFGKEFEVLDFEKLVADQQNLIVVEWPENVSEVFNGLGGYRQLNFKIDDGADIGSGGAKFEVSENTRIITEELGRHFQGLPYKGRPWYN